MKTPIRTTIVFALASGALVVPAAMVLSAYLHWPTALKLAVWVDLTLYGILLTRWGNSRLLPVLFPLGILLGAAVWPGVYSGFFIMALGVLAWMRSGICFQHKPLRSLTAEVITVVGGTAALMLFSAHSSAAWALNICLFFLIQALYFFIVPTHGSDTQGRCSRDPFERAVEEAEKVLDGL